jgi:hypothetical protein
MKYRLALRSIPPMKSAIRLMLLTGWCSHALAGSKPNIIIILADDLGYGDVKCYNPERGKIPTPNIDKLASQGMRFTDAHTSSGVCSPTRYTLLTGRYHWRTRLQSYVVNYLDGPIIAPGRLPLAEKKCVASGESGVSKLVRFLQFEQQATKLLRREFMDHRVGVGLAGTKDGRREARMVRGVRESFGPLRILEC